MLLSLLSSPCLAGPYLHADAGPAYATYFPIDASGVAEHLATRGAQASFAVGHAVDAGPLRLDLGLRAQHLHEQIAGSYSLTERGDAYEANYDYVALLGEVVAASRWASRVNGFAGLTLGTARLFSDRKGEPLRSHQLPVYGTFEVGVLVALVEGIEARAALSWVPPVAKVSVLAPQVGLRVAF